MKNAYRITHGGKLVCEVAGRVSSAAVKRVARVIAKNPTLVHHGLAKGAAYHLTSTLSGPVADVYVPIPMLARSIAQLVSNALNEQVEVTRNTMVGKGSVHSRAGSRSPGGRGRSTIPSRNPAEPVSGEVWSTLRGDKARVIAVTNARVQVLHLDSGNREWFGRSDFLSGYRPPRTRPNPSRSKKARTARGVKRGAGGNRKKRRAAAAGRTRLFGHLAGRRSERIARRALANPYGPRRAGEFRGVGGSARVFKSPRGRWWVEWSAPPDDPEGWDDGGLREVSSRKDGAAFARAWVDGNGLGAATTAAGPIPNPKGRKRSRGNPKRPALRWSSFDYHGKSGARATTRIGAWVVDPSFSNAGRFHGYALRFERAGIVYPDAFNPHGQRLQVFARAASAKAAARRDYEHLWGMFVAAGTLPPPNDFEKWLAEQPDGNPKGRTVRVGDQVRYSREWLRNTGHLTGPVPFMRGTVTAIDSTIFKAGGGLATVQWESGDTLQVLVANLAKVGAPEPNPKGRKAGRKPSRSRRRGGRARRTPNHSGELARAKRTALMWNEFPATGSRRVKVRSLKIPKHLVKLGDLDAVVYRSKKYGGKPKLYEHRFKRPLPVLTSDPDGRAMHIVGGGYTITGDGIVD